jgi:poly(A) polymerase
MPVLTPAYPCMNSTHNVSVSTKEAMLNEFEKAYRIADAIIKRDETGKRVYPELSWKRLFKKFNFFGAYQHYIMITILSIDENLHNRWLGFAESKLRHFIALLEKMATGKPFKLDFRPWPKASQGLAETLTRVDD